MNNSGETILARQQWKIRITGILTVLAVPGVFVPDTFASFLGVEPLWVELASALTFIVAFAFAAWLSRCPNCGLNLLFYGMRHEHVGSWLAWSLNVKTCPRCGYSLSGRENSVGNAG